MHVAVYIESSTFFKNIVCTETKLWHKMNTVLNCGDRNDRCVTSMVTGGVRDRVKSQVRDRSIERCEPFDIGEGMFQGTKLFRKLEDDLDMSDSDA